MPGSKRKRLGPVDFFDQQVLPRLTVEAVYSKVTFTSKQGQYWRGPCPLHGGDNPTAFSVDTQTLGWRCFSHCGSGSVLAFVNGGETPKDPEFVELVRKLADLAGVDTSSLGHELSPGEEARFRQRERESNLYEAFFAHAQYTLLDDAGKDARSYLVEKRGFKEDELENLPFGLYTTDKEIQDHLARQGFTLDEMRNARLIPPPPPPPRMTPVTLSSIAGLAV